MSPQKKMKKRKQLNALIGLTDSSRKKSKQTCGHRLLRTEPSESESSSEEPDFSRHRAGLCGLSVHCYPLCVFIILAACVVCCAGLIWMQIALKEDLDSMKDKIRIMETSQKLSSHEIVKLSEDLKDKQRKLDDIESGDKGLAKLWSNLTEINQKLSALDSAVNHLKANIKSASDLIALPRAVEELQKSVATIGSTVTSVQHDISMIKSVVEERRKGDQLKESTNGGKATNSTPENNNTCFTLKQEIQYIQEGLNELNSTQVLHQSWSGEQIQSIHFMLSNLSRWVSTLEQSSAAAAPHQELQTTGEPVNTGSSVSRRPRFLSQKRYKRGQSSTQKTVMFPGVNSIEDLEKVLHRALQRGVTYEELREVFGSDTPDFSLLQLYDRDEDHMYTLEELQAALRSGQSSD
ncbi:EF-hand calcium-binding domain-containing protein 14-like isoform X2 [Myxocyprinus asiaticus]|uniref:EF-hand calcium-binding domain-containing protein 14-like isoform X2 n=1 Tax=Myxocyprinus asiaticus TaxID=70543 RepID=UPI002221D450|nr:EF-hand calcium-binding domain-containing protein 14-like isoform X2 [Myxocyprinus asiaticus]